MPSTARPHFIVLDACILMSGVLRPALLELAATGRYLPVWSARIGEEWRRNAARLWPIEPGVLEQEWALMQARFPQADAGEVAPYETGLRYSDAKDWHVIAAGLARRARSGLAAPPEVSVLTWNLKDFNRPELRRMGMDVLDPDRLLVRWWSEDAEPVAAVLRATVDGLAAAGRPRQGGMAEILRRERLYRLARLYAARHPDAQAADTAYAPGLPAMPFMPPRAAPG
ncbi:PIN domain-containing protein [Verticiella sediminum]|uniref:PIN domain-containing protein n=1 Tax=Verticiella sediminum TaxID=1247510 RepID=A0A556AYH1_9BURK|nr:PIN domain-containing protein [Verticiella sediminum]TSH97993.1 PIN domain-containing protein [Verticiella sediminum]